MLTFARPRSGAPLGLLALLVACAEPPPVIEFQVQQVAEGAGTVVGAAGALDCSIPSHTGSCGFLIEAGTEGLVVTATAAPGFLFTGWRPLGLHAPDGAVAACAGSSDPDCELPSEVGPVMLRPRFEYPGIVEVAIVGEGTVRSEVHACGEGTLDVERCRRSFPTGTAVTLKASGDGFRGWSAPCYDGVIDCTVGADSLVGITAYFQQDPPVTTRILRVVAAGGGSGRVRSSADGGAAIDCAVAGGFGVGRCAVRLPLGAVVPLTVIPDSGWIAYAIGPPDCQDGTCSLILDQDRNLVARFEPATHSISFAGVMDLGGMGFEGGVTLTSVPAGVDCEVHAEGDFDCGATDFPFGTELLVRAVFGPGTSFSDPDAAWGSCPDGIGACRAFLLFNSWVVDAAFGPKQQLLRIVREDTLVVGTTEVRADSWLDRTWNLSSTLKQFSIDLHADTGSVVVMNYRGAPGVALEGWSGACAGSEACEFVLSGDAEVRYRVVPLPLTVPSRPRSPASQD